MPFLVQLTDDAVRDLEEICDYIEQHDAPSKADHVLEQIERAFGSLAKHPSRGNYPKELLDIGIREYREIFFKPYRIIYRVMGNNPRLKMSRIGSDRGSSVFVFVFVSCRRISSLFDERERRSRLFSPLMGKN